MFILLHCLPRRLENHMKFIREAQVNWKLHTFGCRTAQQRLRYGRVLPPTTNTYVLVYLIVAAISHCNSALSLSYYNLVTIIISFIPISQVSSSSEFMLSLHWPCLMPDRIYIPLLFEMMILCANIIVYRLRGAGRMLPDFGDSTEQIEFSGPRKI